MLFQLSLNNLNSQAVDFAVHVKSSFHDDGVWLMNVVGKLYTISPRIADLPPTTAQLIVRSIAINSAYTSRVLVEFEFLLLNLLVVIVWTLCLCDTFCHVLLGDFSLLQNS